MGRIKSTLIKRTGRRLCSETTDIFNTKFDNNKKRLRDTMPSKRIRNKVAGYITRLNRMKK